MYVFLLEHGVLLAALVDDVAGRAEPDGVDLSLLVHVDQGLLQVGHLESEVLKSHKLLLLRYFSSLQFYLNPKESFSHAA